MFDLSGRTAIVTGGAGILGKHFCQALAVYGANVVVADRDVKSAEQVVAKLDGKPLAYGIDLTKEEEIAAMVQTVRSRYGRIDILHNNAAIETRPARRVSSIRSKNST